MVTPESQHKHVFVVVVGRVMVVEVQKLRKPFAVPCIYYFL
jgi:hypothetical protein